MKILAIERDVPGVSDQAYGPHLANEAARAWELYQAGVIRELHFVKEESRAVLVLECADKAEARAHLRTLPLVARGLIDFDILPLSAYPGFARLFVAR